MEGDQVRKFRFNVLYILVPVLIAVAFLGVFYMESSNGAVPVVSAGDNVSVYYQLSFTNGTVYQSNFNGTPLSFAVGSGQVISGFDKAVIGMKVGETKTVTLPPDEAYGNTNQSLIVTVPKSEFGNASVSVGEKVQASTGAVGVITSLNDTNVTVDFNPPLAGKTLVFEIKLLNITK